MPILQKEIPTMIMMIMIIHVTQEGELLGATLRDSDFERGGAGLASEGGAGSLLLCFAETRLPSDNVPLQLGLLPFFLASAIL